MDAYGSFADLQQAFIDFANKVPFYGAVVACADDAELSAVLPGIKRRVITYGINRPDGPHQTVPVIFGSEVDLVGYGSRSVVQKYERRGGTKIETLGELTLSVPGRHSVQNALAAVAVGLELDVPFAKIAAALAEFRGAERRFEKRGDVNGITVIDDYGHHPTEIAAVLAAARAGKPQRIVVAFQPHRYTRTRDLMNEFGTALATADEVVLTSIYAASEEAIPGVTIDALAASVNKSRSTPVHVVTKLEDMSSRLADLARPGDLVITLGAGSISSLAGSLVAELERRHGGGR
jgi:UDP-N-acetylmuramate--alanine ligase